MSNRIGKQNFEGQIVVKIKKWNAQKYNWIVRLKFHLKFDITATVLGWVYFEFHRTFACDQGNSRRREEFNDSFVWI